MNPFETATSFFNACESLKGWEGCRQYAAENATFEAQSEPLADINSLEDYCNWMAGVGSGPLQGCSYEIHASAFDETNRTALFFATFKGAHTGEGGPVPATGKQTRSHYVYVIKIDNDGKVSHMTKVWNAPWALSELGWV